MERALGALLGLNLSPLSAPWVHHFLFCGLAFSSHRAENTGKEKDTFVPYRVTIWQVTKSTLSDPIPYNPYRRESLIQFPILEPITCGKVRESKSQVGATFEPVSCDLQVLVETHFKSHCVFLVLAVWLRPGTFCCSQSKDI